MTETQNVLETIKSKARQVRESRAFKPVLIAVAMGVGTYLGAKQPMAQISRDVHEMADRTKRIDHNLFTYANQDLSFTEAAILDKKNMRNSIQAAVAEGKPFEYFPGLGVLFPEDNDAPRSKTKKG